MKNGKTTHLLPVHGVRKIMSWVKEATKSNFMISVITTYQSPPGTAA